MSLNWPWEIFITPHKIAVENVKLLILFLTKIVFIFESSVSVSILNDNFQQQKGIEHMGFPVK